MKKYGLHGKLQALPGKGDELAGLLLEAAGLMGTARGCHLYLVCKDAGDADCIWVTEAWDSKQDHDDSLKNDAVRQLIARAMPLLDGRPEGGVELEVLGGLGI